MSSIIAWKRVDFPVEEGPMRYNVLTVEGASIASSRSEIKVNALVVYSMGRRLQTHEPVINGLILYTQPHFFDTEMKIVLLENPQPDQKEWKFAVPPDQLQPRRPAKASGKIYGKRITFTAAAIALEIGELSNNRILQDDDPSKFIAVSFGTLRFPDSFLRVTGEYITRLMETGLYLNGIQYRFYHHSNSQLVRPYLHIRRAKL